jgi:hypothetical protein
VTLWQCSNMAVSDGLLTKPAMLAIGLFFAILSIMPDLRLRGARTPATPIACALFFFIGCLLIFQAARLLFLCN